MATHIPTAMRMMCRVVKPPVGSGVGTSEVGVAVSVVSVAVGVVSVAVGVVSVPSPVPRSKTLRPLSM